ncbi:UDP-N-acetylmuramate dehydrogenase [Tuberibacillus calidus]|uniref:UDP-N-acetylmuramate dehydrogenase n=1 Tax=Tuberibacillus calidus TaxID=340097 RepID=UPI00040DB487|nr:UDP-N-acetylmuramate dehydrogenase [Tuberibacillus calidus]
MNKTEIYGELTKLIDEHKILQDEPLKPHVYTRIGGKADFLVFPSNFEEVQHLVKFSLAHHIPYTILGNGSNLIIRDGGIRGIVINLTDLTDMRLEGEKIIAQCGAAIIDVSRFALKHSLTGLEFACGIPGTVGGAVYMNAGAYGGELKDVLESALILDNQGEMKRLRNDELEFSYRNSLVAQKGYLVLEAVFALTKGDSRAIKEKMDDLTFRRESKQPLEYPSCGSVFKRPPGYFAGKLIQDSGLQGTRIGGAQVSTKHAGFIVNIADATASDYISLIRHVQKTVKEKFNVDLETEVKIIGED